MIDDRLLQAGQVVGSVLVGAWLAISGRSWIRRRTSRDAVELKADRVEIGILERLQIDNADLRREIQLLATERNEALAVRGRLEERVAALTASLEEAQRRIDALDGELRDVRSMLHHALKRPPE